MRTAGPSPVTSRARNAQLDDERSRTIWTQRGAAEQPSTLAQPGQHVEGSRERVRQLEQRLAEAFRRFLEQRLGPHEAKAAGMLC